MFRTAVMATDLSPASQALIGAGTQLKELGVEHIVLLHCFGAMEVSSFTFADGDMAFDQLLKRQGEKLRELGFIVAERTYTGGPQHGVQVIAEETGSDLVVIGSHGHAVRSGLHLGGRAWGIIQHATRPVLVIRLEPHGEKDARTTHNDAVPITDAILFATDFSDNAEQAMRCVTGIAERGAGTITIAHIQDEAVIDPYLLDRRDEFSVIDRGRLDDLVKHVEKVSSADVQAILGYGKPSLELIRLAEHSEPSLLIMGTQGKGVVRELLMGSVSHAVTRHTHCPVLLVPLTG